jgi:hypothetical protein
MDTPFIGRQEFELLQNNSIFLTRKRLQDQLNALLSGCIGPIQSVMLRHADHLPPEILASTPKISRGENYLSFPWTVLDYPRCFSGRDVFALRTMCWWGHYFSISFLVGGRFAELFEERISVNIKQMETDGLYFCSGNDPWKHHLEDTSHQPLASFPEASVDAGSQIATYGFLKLMKKIELDRWSHISEECGRTAEMMFTLFSGDDLPLKTTQEHP